MPKLTNSGEVQADDWQVLSKEAPFDAEQLARGKWLVHIKLYKEHKAEFESASNISVWLDSDDAAADIADMAARLPVISVNFPVFTDGRGFSIGRTLRERHQFSGELRAIGNFMQDQLFYLKRCGFDAFVVKDDADVESMAKSLRDFSDFYQAAVDQPLPLFRRRLDNAG
jgi:uncharacterized protein (DUF934 family)